MWTYQPSEKIVDRAVELWKRLLTKPEFDNGDKSLTGFVGRSLADRLSEATYNSTPEVLDKFGVELKALLMAEVSLEQLQEKPETEKSLRYFHNSLSTDYHPDLILGLAAKRAGLTTQFPWKTSMNLSEKYVALGAGYQAPWEYHYPLSRDRWLVTKLTGDDIDKVLEYVEGGIPTFKVEDGALVTV